VKSSSPPPREAAAFAGSQVGSHSLRTPSDGRGRLRQTPCVGACAALESVHLLTFASHLPRVICHLSTSSGVGVRRLLQGR